MTVMFPQVMVTQYRFQLYSRRNHSE